MPPGASRPGRTTLGCSWSVSGVRASAHPPITDAEAEQLTGFAVLTRYPADLGEIAETEWHRAVALATRVVAWADSALLAQR